MVVFVIVLINIKIQVGEDLFMLIIGWIIGLVIIFVLLKQWKIFRILVVFFGVISVLGVMEVIFVLISDGVFGIV